MGLLAAQFIDHLVTVAASELAIFIDIDIETTIDVV